MLIVYKLFKTYKHNYLYDVSTGKVLNITDDDYYYMSEYQLGNPSENSNLIIANFQKQGLLLNHNIEQIQHPMTAILPHMVNHRLRQLVLQVTQNCNLRCDYCVYSGNYNNREHQNRNMSIADAEKAIDYLLLHSDELDDVSISFYGGEPLLNFDLIKHCVEYVNKNVEDKNVHYSLTTNATLITDTIGDYLYENNFNVMVSLDGDKKQHDAHRKFINGSGTFDCVIDHISNMLNRHPDYSKKVSFNCVISEGGDIDSLDRLLEKDKILSKVRFHKTYVSKVLLKTENDINKLENLQIMKEKFDYLKSLIQLIQHKEITSALSRPLIDKIIDFYNGMQDIAKLPSIYGHGGPCLPGVKKLFVTVNGSLFPCERINELNDAMKLGTIQSGVNIDKAIDVLNINNIGISDCKTCWAIRECTFCGQVVEDITGYSEKLRLNECIKNKLGLLRCLYEVCILRELGFDFKDKLV